MHTINIDLVSDVVCPWCYLGKARLELAIAEIQDEVSVIVNWRPYQLNPDYPPEGVDHQAELAKKLGGKDKMDAIHGQLTELGKQVGINFHFDAIKRGPNTLDAHRLIHWAGTEGREQQNAVVSALFKANFEEGRNIGDHAVLIDIASACGLDPRMVEQLLASGADADFIREEIEAARQMGVNGVPFFIIDQRYAVSGAQPVETLANAFREIAAEKGAAQQKLN
ncbi:DsbA family oxidoreductase [Allorhizobium sp. BGMRC 0089]|uniref:DsbA family oxidoreductase n=1 Tax=Allorhizobium sonneratiae TaxID=2934936 RepID=UPI002033B54A|nr:DsbA family oxidoreductase [Allorhizobium sonneratiae]MCM2292955.1 DsbA family oxidoreductase [Allorhizobium sonneratiae]